MQYWKMFQWTLMSLYCLWVQQACQMTVDVQGVLVGIWLLVTFRFQPSPLASKLRAASRKGEQSVSLPLPVNSFSTASPMQCLLVEAGVTGCCKTLTLNLQGRLLYNPTTVEQEETPNGCKSGWGCTRLMQPNEWWIRQKRRKLPTAVTVDEVAQVISQRWIRRKRRRLPKVVKA